MYAAACIHICREPWSDRYEIIAIWHFLPKNSTNNLCPTVTKLAYVCNTSKSQFGGWGVLYIKELLYLHQINLILVVLSILLLSFARTSNSLRYHNSKDKLTWQAIQHQYKSIMNSRTIARVQIKLLTIETIIYSAYKNQGPCHHLIYLLHIKLHNNTLL